MRELLGFDFLKVLNCSYSALRLLVLPIAEAQKGSGAIEGLLSREGEHFLGGTAMWGMRVCRMLVSVGTCDRVFPVVYEPLAWLGIPLPGWSLVPAWG